VNGAVHDGATRTGNSRVLADRADVGGAWRTKHPLGNSDRVLGGTACNVLNLVVLDHLGVAATNPDTAR
jgi:hypothetical protein